MPLRRFCQDHDRRDVAGSVNLPVLRLFAHSPGCCNRRESVGDWEVSPYEPNSVQPLAYDILPLPRPACRI